MICEIKNLTLKRNSGNVFSSQNRQEVLSNINLSINHKSFHILIGESGSGKTSLLKCIAGLEKNIEGEIVINNKLINDEKKEIQMLFQNNGELLNPVRKVFSLFQDVIGNDLQKAENMLKKFNLRKEILLKKSFELSGGEHQRIALIRLLLSEPKLLLLDEPFASQDIESNEIILENLSMINKENNTTILCVTHYIKPIKKTATEISVLKDGKIIESGPANDVINNPKKDFTKLFIESMKY